MTTELNQEQIDNDTAIIAGAVLKLAKIMLNDTATIGDQMTYAAQVDQDADGIVVSFTFKPVQETVGLFLPEGI